MQLASAWRGLAADMEQRRRVLAQVGVGAQGGLFVIVGVLAFQLATGHRQRRTDPKGALELLAHQPLGGVLVGVLAGGLAAYAVAKGLRALRGHRQRSAKRDARQRLADAAVALIYGALAAVAISLLTTGRSGSGGGRERTLTARLLNAPLGRALFVIAGVTIIVAAVIVSLRHIRRGPTEQLATASGIRHRLATSLYPAGIVARGFVFVLIGILVTAAAINHQSSDVTGMDGALRRLSDGAGGRVLLLAVAVGMLLYGVSRILMAPDILDAS